MGLQSVNVEKKSYTPNAPKVVIFLHMVAVHNKIIQVVCMIE